MTELKEEINNSAIIVDYFFTPASKIVSTSQKVRKDYGQKRGYYTKPGKLCVGVCGGCGTGCMAELINLVTKSNHTAQSEHRKKKNS